MHTSLKNIFITAAVLMPISANAIEVSGKDLEVYGEKLKIAATLL